jgi:hypothetical protein
VSLSVGGVSRCGRGVIGEGDLLPANGCGWRMVDYFHMTRRPDLTDFELTYATPLHPEVA